VSVERSILVALPRTAAIGELLGDIISAAERAEGADPGERGDVVRYESLSVQLESLAHQALAAGGDHRVAPEVLPVSPGYCFEATEVSGDSARLGARLPGPLASVVEEWGRSGVAVELRLPFDVGAAGPTEEVGPAARPASVWQAEGDVVGNRAIEQRFRRQLKVLVTRGPDAGEPSRDGAINPSGVHNRVITQVLREFVAGAPATRLDVPIVYRDGSEAANPFPLSCLELGDELPDRVDQELHLALLSIRHTEMDPVVDGAWLRNAEVSRPRPAALTDDFVYETSLTQLRALSDEGRRSLALHIYQTGLETAVVGFYRAVVAFQLEHPGSLSVVPMFFASAKSRAGVEEEARFEPGRPWTVGGAR
jgi:hypothetical protein